MRIFAILNKNKDIDVCKNIVEKLPKGSKVVIYSADEGKNVEISGIDAKFVKIPEDLMDRESKIRNFIVKSIKNEGFTGFLHVSSDQVALDGDPERLFDEVEDMMKVFGLKSWFNTALDGCNYVLTKYNPRFSVDIDVENSKLKAKKVNWCSNANTEWTIFDLDGARDEDILFCEDFGISMYYIIEFLARRRNRKSPGDLHYMNMYPGLDSELGVLKSVQVQRSPDPQEQFRKENEIVQNMKVDNHPDMDIDQIMTDIATKLNF